jgi:glycosyltransferase involved in cell wall biosynthesis
MIPTYNCAKYLEQTLKSVLSQDLGVYHMQIEVIDDCSTIDDPEEVVNRIGRGRVFFFKQKNNVGPIKNFNTCLSRAKGELIHILHGDDYILDNFYSSFHSKFLEYNNVGIIISNCFIINHNDEIKEDTNNTFFNDQYINNINNILYSNPIRTPSVVVKKSAYLKFGNFDESLNHCADWDMWVRIIFNAGGFMLSNRLCVYREHNNNDSTKRELTSEIIDDYKKTYSKFYANGYPIDKIKIKNELKKIFLFLFKKIVLSNNKNSVIIYLKKSFQYLNIKEIFYCITFSIFKR